MASDSRPVGYPLRIVGTGRCGTVFMTRQCRERGLMIGHDKLARDGACGLAWCDPDPMRCKADTLPLGTFRTTWHLVRHPLACIASLAFTPMLQGFWPWIGRRLALPLDPLERAMAYWHRWNLRCERLADMRIRIEDMAGEPVNCMDHRPVTWADVNTVDKTLARRIQSQGQRYGYLA